MLHFLPTITPCLNKRIHVTTETRNHLEAEVVSTGAAHLENTPTILIFVPTAVWGHTKLPCVVAESEMKQRKLKTLGNQLLIRRNREPKRQWEELLLSTSEDPEPYEPKNLKDAMSSA